jgi:hypothetical protein
VIKQHEEKRIKIIIVSLSFLTFNCSKKNNEYYESFDQRIWSLERKGVISDCVFSEEGDKFFLITSTGIFCYNSGSGKSEWKNEKVVYCNTALLFENILVTADTRKPSIYYIDIETGKILNRVDFEEYIFMIQVESENTLLIASGKSMHQFQLLRYNISSDTIEDLLTLDGKPKSQLKYYCSVIDK